MKKILFGAFALAFAFSAQAVSITWNVVGLNAPGEGTIVWGEKQLVGITSDGLFFEYFWTGTGTAPSTGAALSNQGSATITVSEGKSGVTPFSHTFGGSTYAKGSGTMTGTTGDVLPASTDDLFASITVTFGEWTVTASDYFNTTPSGGQANVSFANVTWTWTGTKTTFEPVPEPATMALLGIGIVAVGLRRRRK